MEGTPQGLALRGTHSRKEAATTKEKGKNECGLTKLGCHMQKRPSHKIIIDGIDEMDESGVRQRLLTFQMITRSNNAVTSNAVMSQE